MFDLREGAWAGMCSWTHLLNALYAPAARFTSSLLLVVGPAPHPLPPCLRPDGRRLAGLRCSHGQYKPGLLSVPVSFPADCITVVESRAGLTLEYDMSPVGIARDLPLVVSLAWLDSKKKQ
jgi:hypothetical protein